MDPPLPAWTSSPGMSYESARAIVDVDVLVLMASDMEQVGCKFKSEFGNEITHRSDVWRLLESDKVVMLRKVPKLKTMDNQVLEAISLHLVPHLNFVRRLISKGGTLDRMIFVTRGSVYTECHSKPEGNFFGEELLEWVLDTSFPTLLPISTYEVEATRDTVSGSRSVDFYQLTVEDLASVVFKYRSHFSSVITPPTDLLAFLTLHYLTKVPMFEAMDEDVVLKEICKHMKHMTYSSDTVIIEKHKPLEMMFVLLQGESIEVSGSMFSYDCYMGDFYGLELVHWITNWASYTNLSAKLPLSHTSAKVRCNYSKRGKAEVAVIWADDLKRIVSEYRSDFMKQTTLPIDLEGKLAMVDTLIMVKKVPLLQHLDEEVLKAICSHLKPMKYSDYTPDEAFIFKPNEKINKMCFVRSGLVSLIDCDTPKSQPYYSGNYFGEQLLEWVLDASVDKVPNVSRWRAYKCVGEVEVLVLMAEDLAKVVSQFDTHFVRQITSAFLRDTN